MYCVNFSYSENINFLFLTNLSLSLSLSHFFLRSLSICSRIFNGFLVIHLQKPQMASTAMSSLTSTMASISTMASSSTTSPINLVNQPLLLLSKMANIMTMKLDSTKYIVWKHQITMVLDTYSMFELLNET